MMTDADKPAFWAELQRLGVAFGAHIDGPLGKVYWDALVDLELATLAEGMRDCIEAMKFFPKVADLRDAEYGARARREQVRVQKLLSVAPAKPEQPGISADQWRERWAVLTDIVNRVPMKPHDGLEGDRCQCADHQRRRRGAGHVSG
jgi:hypothetical protein